MPKFIVQAVAPFRHRRLRNRRDNVVARAPASWRRWRQSRPATRTRRGDPALEAGFCDGGDPIVRVTSSLTRRLYRQPGAQNVCAPEQVHTPMVARERRPHCERSIIDSRAAQQKGW